jgi:CheY-like chemotaxis protein
VLLVEDETLVAFLFQDVLEEQGCVVIGPTASLREALELVKADPAPDAAVMDLNLRGELSWPAIEVLARRGVPVVITSGYVGLDPAREAAAAEVIAKPVSSERLVKAMARAVSQKNGARSG